ncbi:UNVERIFIED_CONTAM: hypothetical protein Scaly_2044300 [Sesamum calycinum]|uniref:Uncharacterized protein n=1 Tax=Sesamum calycinum TaxID=2727403 RepID=A0AAW2N4H5_9LAMI
MSHIEDEGTSHQRPRGSNEDKLGTRRTWTAREEEFLINGLKLLASSGWKCDNGFRYGYLIQLENCMIRAFLNCGIKAEPHISSKIQCMGETILIRGMLCGIVFPLTGYFNFCYVMALHVIIHMQIYPTAKTMRYKSWSYLPAWCQIFRKDRATGEHAQDAHQAAASIREEEQAVMNTAKRTTTSSKKRKADKIIAELPKLVEVLANFFASANNGINALTRVLENEFGDPIKRGLVLEAVKQLTTPSYGRSGYALLFLAAKCKLRQEFGQVVRGISLVCLHDAQCEYSWPPSLGAQHRHRNQEEFFKTHSTSVEIPNPVAFFFLSFQTGPAMSMCIHWTFSSTNCNKPVLELSDFTDYCQPRKSIFMDLYVEILERLFAQRNSDLCLNVTQSDNDTV